MPDRAPKPCAQPGCGALVHGARYCPAHAHLRRGPVRRLASEHAAYNRTWEAFRTSWLRQHPLCGDRLGGPSPEHSRCVRLGMKRAATDVDHIVPMRGDLATQVDPHAVQSLCHACHSAKTQREVNARAHG